MDRGCSSMVEQLICVQEVESSSLFNSTIRKMRRRMSVMNLMTSSRRSEKVIMSTVETMKEEKST